MTKKPQSFYRILPRFAAILSLFIASLAPAQPVIYENGQPTLVGTDASVHIDNQHRRKIDLAGTWSYSIDNESWQEVKIPASFDYKGRVIFMRKFLLDRTALSSSSFHLVGLGINLDAEIFVNDVFVGRHVGGYTTVDIDLPETALQLGSENAIKIIVNNNLSSRSTLPLRKQILGWRDYAGILRDIYLLVTPRLWIDKVSLRSSVSQDLTQASAEITAVLNSKLLGSSGDTLSASIGSAQPLFAVDVIDKSSGAVVGTSAPQPVSVQVNHDYEVKAAVGLKSPRLWSPESPDLYVVRARLFIQQGRLTKVIDESDCVTGFRRFEANGNAFQLNGKSISVRGVVWHEDIGRRGSSLTYEQMERDITLMKTLGANAVRFAFHPPHPYVLNLCDRYGLLVFEEIPAVSVPPDILEQENFRILSEASITETIERDRHRPSVVAWGLGDDLDPSDDRTCGFVERLAAAVEKLDTRPVYFGSRVFANDKCAGKTAIAAYRVSFDKSGSLKSATQMWMRAHPGQPVVLLAYGKDVEPENRNGWSDPMSQEAQAEYFKKSFQILKEAGIAGSFIDAFADWRGDRPWMSVGSGSHTTYPVGLLSYVREKRASFEMVKLLYNGEKTTALPIGRYRASFPVAHIAWGFVIIFVVAYLYHYNRRFNESFKRALIRSYNFFADLRDVHTVSVPQTFVLAAAVALTLGVITSGILFRFRSDMLADSLITSVFVSDPLKEKLISAVWQPFLGILVFSVVYVLFFPLIALFIKVFAFLVKRRVYWYHAFAVAVWGSLPIVMLSPVGMALFKLLQAEVYVVPTFALLGVFVVWSFLRIIKGVSVIYDISRVRAYAGGCAVVLVILGALFIYYESTYALTAYIEFFVNLGRSLS